MNFKKISDLKNARILICNDDGFGADGIKVLEEAIKTVCNDVWVVAPNSQKSGVGHSVSSTLSALEGINTAGDLPTHIFKIDERHYAVEGTPADCIHIALNVIMKNKLPDLIVSGINYGRNLAEDVTYSGTVGAAIEGIIQGVFSIAFSQHLDRQTKTDWELPRQYIAPLTQAIANMTFPVNTLVNINFPNCNSTELKGIDITRVGEWRFSPDDSVYDIADYANLEGDYFYPAKIKNDFQSVLANKISITPVSIDLTDYDSIEKLQNTFKNFAV